MRQPGILATLTLPTKVPSDSLGRIGSLKRTSDKALFPMALGSCGHRITHQLRPINMNGRSILSVTSHCLFFPVFVLLAQFDSIESIPQFVLAHPAFRGVSWQVSP